jgi:hypothetical protein
LRNADRWPGGFLLAELPPPSISAKKVRLNFNQLFDFQLAEGIRESVRSDKASRAGIWALVVSPENRYLRICRRADLQLPSGRLKLPVCQSADKCSSGDSRTTTNARERNEQREGCARVTQNFLLSPNGILARAFSKHDFVTCAARGRCNSNYKGPKRDRERKAFFCLSTL